MGYRIRRERTPSGGRATPCAAAQRRPSTAPRRRIVPPCHTGASPGPEPCPPPCRSASPHPAPCGRGGQCERLCALRPVLLSPRPVWIAPYVQPESPFVKGLHRGAPNIQVAYYLLHSA
eukprot:3829095-Pleurochrysis_carterae.AAC.1